MWLFEDQWQLTGQFFSLIDFALSAIHVCHCIVFFRIHSESLTVIFLSLEAVLRKATIIPLSSDGRCI